MGWVEFLAWIGAMRKQREGAQPKEDSWDVEDPWFEEMKRRRREGSA